MSPTPRQYAEIGDFPGLTTNADGPDIPPGAALEQVNMMSNRKGELTARPGLLPVLFEDEP